ncbi:hypothetical protein [Clostridium tetani]|uniref:Uncharacterized protein n=1 Tax=Clostridium tetani TaxID=1513 RepID=A0ABY0ELL3_CLOTA|nr:hypothetical protein [Clostridium tetani]CDI49728.1 hypothetical protein BN906_01732 [Clostridium tetani 12124569]KHO38985.1 hypothetical protein OR62_08375 [Clostridium tetani]RXI38009.1 hypothetical protein DP129_11700 [Clostridium tetani]RXI52435.1 hypothetical protein DP131_12925 [Clostridium tetani]RXI70074.1 hypothetical protein DQN76_07615 [Clostridium tetani]
MKNKRAVFLLIILTSILFATIYLNINIFREKNVIKSSNIELKKTIEKKDMKETLSYNKIMESFNSNDLVVKSFEKSKEEEMIFDIIYKGDSEKFKDILDNIRNGGYKYEIIKINMNFKENKGESLIKLKIHP